MTWKKAGSRPPFFTTFSSIFGLPLDKIARGIPERAPSVSLTSGKGVSPRYASINSARASAPSGNCMALQVALSADSVTFQKSSYRSISERSQVYSNCFVRQTSRTLAFVIERSAQRTSDASKDTDTEKSGYHQRLGHWQLSPLFDDNRAY